MFLLISGGARIGIQAVWLQNSCLGTFTRYQSSAGMAILVGGYVHGKEPDKLLKCWKMWWWCLCIPIFTWYLHVYVYGLHRPHFLKWIKIILLPFGWKSHISYQSLVKFFSPLVIFLNENTVGREIVCWELKHQMPQDY